MKPLHASVAIALAAVVILTGCPGEDEPSNACSDYTPPPSFDPAQPKVSFSADVMPIFQQSCAFSTCHGSNIGDANGVYLGQAPARVHAALVGTPSRPLPSMPHVTAGNPGQSFLMRKLDGSQCVLDTQCVNGSCGASMPKGDALLPVERRDVIRRWIAQGAKND